MKFEEKLVKLRKQNVLSQEELAEKLNVTRQTVSKWELGQSRPDMDKLITISQLFNIGTDVLTNDEITLDNLKEEKNENSKTKEKGNRKFLVYILSIILIVCIIILAIRVSSVIKVKIDEVKAATQARQEEWNKKQEEFDKKQKETEDKIEEAFQQIAQKNKENEEKQKEDSNRLEIKGFNSKFEIYLGSDNGFMIKNSLIDPIITNNKTEKEHMITVKYREVESSEPEEIKKLKSRLKDFTNYETSAEYDENGFINLLIIEDI